MILTGWFVYVILAMFSMTAAVNIFAVWKLFGIFKAFDDIILKTLTDTTMIERHKLFVDTLTKFGENDRKRKDKEFADMRAVSKNIETDLRTARALVDSLRKDK